MKSYELVPFPVEMMICPRIVTLCEDKIAMKTVNDR